MPSGDIAFPTRRATAERNRDRILTAAREAFADPAAEVSMAEIARRAGVGMATLYRNFPGRRELLEALYADEVDTLCRAAAVGPGQSPGAALFAWLRRLFAFVPNKRLIVSELLKHCDHDGAVIPGRRAVALAAGRPLLDAAQDSGEVRDDLSLDQIFDMVVAVATIHGDTDYLQPIIEAMLNGLRGPADPAGAER